MPADSCSFTKTKVTRTLWEHFWSKSNPLMSNFINHQPVLHVCQLILFLSDLHDAALVANDGDGLK